MIEVLVWQYGELVDYGSITGQEPGGRSIAVSRRHASENQHSPPNIAQKSGVSNDFPSRTRGWCSLGIVGLCPSLQDKLKYLAASNILPSSGSTDHQ